MKITSHNKTFEWRLRLVEWRYAQAALLGTALLSNMKHLTLLFRVKLLNVCFFHKFRFLTQFYFLFNGTNTWNLVCDRSGLTAMAERKPTSEYGSLVFFNEQDAVEGKGLNGLNFL